MTARCKNCGFKPKEPSGGRLKNPSHLRLYLGISKSDFEIVEEAARDAHMSVRDYCRLMVLCAAGMGGVIEHLGRANDASFSAATGKQP